MLPSRLVPILLAVLVVISCPAGPFERFFDRERDKNGLQVVYQGSDSFGITKEYCQETTIDLQIESSTRNYNFSVVFYHFIWRRWLLIRIKFTWYMTELNFYIFQIHQNFRDVITLLRVLDQVRPSLRPLRLWKLNVEMLCEIRRCFTSTVFPKKIFLFVLFVCHVLTLFAVKWIKVLSTNWAMAASFGWKMFFLVVSSKNLNLKRAQTLKYSQ